MTPYPVTQPELIGLASPADKADFSLTLFLYQIKENNEYRSFSGGGGLPPLALDLHYLLTPHSTADVHTRTLDEHRILGRAMQVLYENGTISGSLLQGTLAERGEPLRIVRDQVPNDMIASLFPQMPYRLSAAYLVGPVYLDTGGGIPTPRVTDPSTRMDGNA